MTTGKGLFITFEGVDKAGKSTQIRLLRQRLEERGYTVLCTREPGGTELCERIRELVMQFKQENIASEAELMLFSASRAQLLRQLVWPELEKGHVVLCDRFADSTTAYQGYARWMDLEFIRTLNNYTLGGRWPDLTILLDLDARKGLDRLQDVQAATHVENDRFEDEGTAFQERVRKGFLEIARQEPGRIAVVPAAQPIDAVAAAVWERVQPILPSR